MANEGDEVLLNDPNDSEFSGFGPEDVEPRSGSSATKKQKEAKLKKANKTGHVSKKGKSSQPKASTSSAPQTQCEANSPSFDQLLAGLTDSEIEKLRQMFGFEEYNEEENLNFLFGDDLPNLHIEVSEDPDNELSTAKKAPKSKKPLQPTNLSQNIIDAMFESDTENQDNQDDDFWDLPRVKGPIKGPAISNSLANLINTTCTSQCVTDDLVAKYRVPENCDKLCAPMINNEIWKILNKRAQSYDKCFSDIQNLVATGMVPVIKLFEVVKPHIAGNQEAKTLFSDIITMMGQVQYNLSLRRRYMIKPHLKKKYHNLCHISMPISNKLFGDDVSKEVKNSDTGISIAKDGYNYNYYRPYRGRGMFPNRGNYRGSGMRSFRYQPYQQFGNMARDVGYQRGYQRQRFGSFRGRNRNPSATVASAPNDLA